MDNFKQPSLLRSVDTIVTDNMIGGDGMGKFNLKMLRKASKAVYLATEESVAKDLSEILTWAADEIDRLEKALWDEGYNI